MKKFLIFSLAVICMISCSQSPDNKAKLLIRESVEKALVHPESYKPLETVIDSAYAPFDDPAFYKKTLEICKMNIVDLDDSQAEEVQRCIQELIDLMGTEYRFIGYKVTHSYSAQDDTGEVLSGEKVYIMDKGMTDILAEYDTGSLNYIMVQTMYKLWRDESLENLQSEVADCNSSAKK